MFSEDYNCATQSLLDIILKRPWLGGCSGPLTREVEGLSVCIAWVEVGLPISFPSAVRSSHVSNGSVELGKPASADVNSKASCTWRGNGFRPVSTGLLAGLWQVPTLPHSNEHLLFPLEQWGKFHVFYRLPPVGHWGLQARPFTLDFVSKGLDLSAW